MKYRKKPVVVEAEEYKMGLEDGFCLQQYLPDNVDTNGLVSFADFEVSCLLNHYDTMYPYIKTLEGNHYISEGDYIITGVKGERYPCKKDIFEMTYDKVEE